MLSYLLSPSLRVTEPSERARWVIEYAQFTLDHFSPKEKNAVVTAAPQVSH